MTIRVENYRDGALVDIDELVDVAGTITYRLIVAGSVVEERQATSDEQAVYAENIKQQRIDQIHNQFTGGVRTLRQWSTQAQNTTVTSGNAVVTLQTVVDRLSVFFDRFADLLVLLDQVDIDDFD